MIKSLIKQLFFEKEFSELINHNATLISDKIKLEEKLHSKQEQINKVNHYWKRKFYNLKKRKS